VYHDLFDYVVNQIGTLCWLFTVALCVDVIYVWVLLAANRVIHKISMIIDERKYG